MTSVAVAEIELGDDAEQPRRMRKKAVQQGRSERRGDAYSGPYVEPLSEARTPRAVFFRILLAQLPQFGHLRVFFRPLRSRNFVTNQ